MSVVHLTAWKYISLMKDFLLFRITYFEFGAIDKSQCTQLNESNFCTVNNFLFPLAGNIPPLPASNHKSFYVLLC